jgi:protein arginine kinase activator
MNGMLCQHCQKNTMTMKITKIHHGVATEYNICDECAPKISQYYKKMQAQNTDKTQVENILKELLEQGGATIEQGGGGAASDEENEVVCENCKLSYGEFRKGFMLGCPKCYDSFGMHILTDIRKIHGSTRHIGGSSSSTPVVPVEEVVSEPSLVEESASTLAPVEEVVSTPPPVEEVNLKALLRDLQSQLKQSVEAEDFDRAATLRDEINSVKEKTEQDEGNKD